MANLGTFTTWELAGADAGVAAATFAASDTITIADVVYTYDATDTKWVIGDGTGGKNALLAARTAAAGVGVPSEAIRTDTTNPTIRSDGTALQAGDFYYNTVDENLYVYDGTAWRSNSWYNLIGPRTTDPTVRDNGEALQEGDIYYNTTDDAIKTYDGTAWASASGSSALGSNGIDLIYSVSVPTDTSGSVSTLPKFIWETTDYVDKINTIVDTTDETGSFINCTGGTLSPPDGLGNRYVGDSMVLLYQQEGETNWRYTGIDAQTAWTSTGDQVSLDFGTRNSTFAPTANYRLGIAVLGRWTSGTPAVDSVADLSDGGLLGYTVSSGLGTRTQTWVGTVTITLSAPATTYAGTHVGDFA